MEGIQEWTNVPVLLTTLGALFFVALLLRTSRRTRHRLPPGPRGWPIIGSLPSIGTLPHRSLHELSKQYGPLMLLHLGAVRTVVVSSAKVAEEILKTHDKVTASRPHGMVQDTLFPSGGVVWSPNDRKWRYLRKICTQGLLTTHRIRQFRALREREVLASLHFILEESQLGNAVDMAECLHTLAFNNMTQMMMNKSYRIRRSSSKTEPSEFAPMRKTPIQKTFPEGFVIICGPNIADFVPLLRPFDPQGLKRRLKDVRQKLDEFLDEIIEDHRQRQSTPGDYKEDFVDALLGFGQTAEFTEKLSMDLIKGIMMDMMGAAEDTSSGVVHWALTELMRHPHVMRRVQEELDSVVGPHRLVQEEDLSELKYLNAVVKEVFRLRTVTPILVPRESTQDCEIQGFHVPAKTRIFVNLWAILRDPDEWERPLEFDPDRFLNSTLDFRGKDFKFIPFSSGMRMCPGINLGLLMVMYPLALFLHAVHFTLPEGQKPEEIDMSEISTLALLKRIPLTVFGKARLPNQVIYAAQQA